MTVPRPSARARQQLPVLSRLIAGLAYVATKLPGEGAREMALAVQYDHRRDVDPYGKAQPMVRMLRGLEGAADITRRYDINDTIAHSYEPHIEGSDAIIFSEHRASRALQVPYKGRPGRRSHPTPGEGLGTWHKRIERMNRRLLFGAVMGAEARQKAAADAEQRRIDRHARRNTARVAAGLKPLTPRKRTVRRDRARIDALVQRAKERAGGLP